MVRINPEKSDLINIKSKSKTDQEKELNFGGNVVTASDKTKHLGLFRNKDNTIDVEERISTTRGTIYGLLGAGLHIRRGFSPTVSHSLWRTYAIPRGIYGLEIMPLRKSDVNRLENMQKKILRQFQGLPNNCANTATYVLLGAEPIEVTIEKNMLSFFMNILRNPHTTEFQLINRQLAMVEYGENNFVNRISKILWKYGFKSCHEYIQSPVPKGKWKAIVKKSLNSYWRSECIEDQKQKTSMAYLQIQQSPLGEPHNVWKSVGNDNKDIRAGEVKARMLTQTYIFQEVRAKYNGNNTSPVCPLCKAENENLLHFLLKCENLTQCRTKHLNKIEQLCESYEKGLYKQIIREDLLMQLVMDCTSEKLQHKPINAHRIETVSRRMCYDMHLERAKILIQ